LFVVCPSGSYAEVDATSCAPCPAGYTCSASMGALSKCPDGYLLPIGLGAVCRVSRTRPRLRGRSNVRRERISRVRRKYVTCVFPARSLLQVREFFGIPPMWMGQTIGNVDGPSYMPALVCPFGSSASEGDDLYAAIVRLILIVLFCGVNSSVLVYSFWRKRVYMCSRRSYSTAGSASCLSFVSVRHVLSLHSGGH